MNKKKFEKAKRYYDAAEDELDSGALLALHKKHYHTCFHARESIRHALKAAWFAAGSNPGAKTVPELLRDLRHIDGETFSKLEKCIPHVEKIERLESLPLAVGKEFAKEDSELFVDVAYKILTVVKALIKHPQAWAPS